jgi:hypothetical protein
MGSINIWFINRGFPKFVYNGLRVFNVKGFGSDQNPILRKRRKRKQKVYFFSLNFRERPFSSLNSKTGQTTSLNFSNRAFYLPGAVLKAGCYSNRWYTTVNGGFAAMPVFCVFFFFYLFRLNF